MCLRDEAPMANGVYTAVKEEEVPTPEEAVNLVVGEPYLP